ncbi:MAG: bifunctional phosphoribosylaminoimidazolecarboxamide formyltransferase/IMP cyclohydrolase [Pseudomonadota bacterium]
MTSQILPVTAALLSVSDKTGLPAFAKALSEAGAGLISTGGTAALLRQSGLGVRDVAEITGFPEMMGGRVKTLHPMIHGGLLAKRSDAEHRTAMDRHGIAGIDLVAVNLYPFEAAVAKGASFDECIETIDIGGPAMIRSAAKNHASVAVIVDPEDYALVAEEIAEHGGTRAETRQRLAQIAFARTAAYDAAISNWFAEATEESAPRRRVFAGARLATLRYGENPHQRAQFYRDSSERAGLASATQHQGKALSYNNINDTDAALELAASLDPARPGCVIVKHANPCGVAQAETLAEAYARAYDCDRTSAFGGIVALNRALDAETAEAIASIFTEVVIAPGADEAACAVFAAKPKLRLLTLDALPDPEAPRLAFTQVGGGFLVQDADTGRLGANDLRVATKRAPSPEELADLRFAWTVAKHVKSNAIVYARDGATVGIGAGQMSRVDATRIAARKAADMAETLGLSRSPAQGAVVASDAFFPFADGLLAAAEAGATAVIQPGGSVRDTEVIEAADAAGLAMVFTGMRHFRH